MNRGLILIVTLIVLAAAQAQKQAAQSAMFIEHRITAPTAEFTASTDKTFDQLMANAVSVMHKGMHTAPQTGDPDHDFVIIRARLTWPRRSCCMAKTRSCVGWPRRSSPTRNRKFS